MKVVLFHGSPNVHSKLVPHKPESKFSSKFESQNGVYLTDNLLFASYFALCNNISFYIDKILN